MPELPEVETIRRSLVPHVPARITGVSLSPVAPIRHSPRSDMLALRGATIGTIGRRGKFLLFPTERATLVVHLGMSGRLLAVAADAPAPAHTHLEIRFANARGLRYVDPRRFGLIAVARAPDATDLPPIAGLGPEFDDPALTPERFTARCRRHHGLSLKSLLLHQGVVAGIGNIYACETLYHARLDPRQRVRDTSDADFSRLLAGIRTALDLGIRHGGTTLRDYVDGSGKRGGMQHFLQVYGRADQPQVTRFAQNGRTTWWCPSAQRQARSVSDTYR